MYMYTTDHTLNHTPYLQTVDCGRPPCLLRYRQSSGNLLTHDRASRYTTTTTKAYRVWQDSPRVKQINFSCLWRNIDGFS